MPPETVPPTEPGPVTVTAALTMCSVADWIGTEDECLRVAQWRIDPPDEHPVFLCNYHAEPFVPLGNYGSVSRADA